MPQTVSVSDVAGSANSVITTCIISACYRHYDSGIRSLNIMLDHDVSAYDPDGPLPDIPESNASKSSRDRIADEMEAWLHEEGSDGFNIMFPFVPAGLEAFTSKVVPELQRRGLFRTEYEGTTLRDHLRLPRPANRFFAQEAERVAAE